jgi:hypothetical protein
MRSFVLAVTLATTVITAPVFATCPPRNSVKLYFNNDRGHDYSYLISYRDLPLVCVAYILRTFWVGVQQGPPDGFLLNYQNPVFVDFYFPQSNVTSSLISQGGGRPGSVDTSLLAKFTHESNPKTQVTTSQVHFTFSSPHPSGLGHAAFNNILLGAYLLP